MSKSSRHPFVGPLWLLVQAFWVGSLWGFHFVMLPAIHKLGFASLLIADIQHAVVPALLAVAGCGVFLQLFLLQWVTSLAQVWRDPRGQLLLLAQLFVLGFYGVALIVSQPQQLQFFCYLAVAISGLMLFFQPILGASAEAKAPSVNS